MSKIFLKILAIPGLVFLNLSSTAQDTIKLVDLYNAILVNNPISRSYSGVDSIFLLKENNLKLNYYPKLDLNAQATWQSDVTKLDINLPMIPGFNVPSPAKDQYKITLDITQMIWDGGITKSKKQVEKVNKNFERNKLDIELYSAKEKITGLFFSFITLNVYQQQLDLMANELDRRILELESAVANGYILQSSLDALKAEKLRLLQNIDAIPSQKQALNAAINALTGRQITDKDILVIPEPKLITSYSCFRPDFKNYSIQNDLLNASSNLLDRKRYPVLAGFAQAGYGKPGLSMLSNEWDTFYLFGARLTWNIWDWNSTSREKQQLKIQSNIVNLRKQYYLDNYNALVDEVLSEIDKLKNQLAKDEEIVKLLHQVTERSASLLKNGTITSAVYLADFNTESRARLEMEIRKIKLSLEKVKLYNVTGNSIN